MTTFELIQQALADQSADSAAAEQLAAAQARKTETAAAVVASSQALHDDLVQNGPAVTVSADQPPVVTEYQAAFPESFTATVLRVAQ